MYTFESVDIIITKSDDTTETFHLEAPTGQGEDRFQFGFRKLTLKTNYRDPNLILRRGFDYYQFICFLSYDWHRMDPRPLLAAKKIALKIPPDFYNPGSYQTWDVRLENDEAVRNWLKGLVMAAAEYEADSTPEERDPVPSGSLTLELAGVDPLQEAEVLAARYYQSVIIGWYDANNPGPIGAIQDLPGTWRETNAVYYPPTDMIYLCLPFDGSSYQDRIFTYNRETGAFTDVGISVDTELSGFVTGGGGVTSRFIRNNTILICSCYHVGGIIEYNIDTNTVIQLYTNNDHKNGLSAYDYDSDVLYLFPGQSASLSATRKYDFSTGTVTAFAAAPETIYGGGGAVYFSGKIYINMTNENHFYAYDIGTDTYVQLSDVPEKFGYIWEKKGFIYGLSDVDRDPSIHRYNIIKDEWSTVIADATAPTTKRNSIDVVIGNQLWCLGGHDGSVTIDNVQVAVFDV